LSNGEPVARIGFSLPDGNEAESRVKGE